MTPITVQSMYIFHEVDSFVKNCLDGIKGRETFTKDILSWSTDELNRLYVPFLKTYDPTYWYAQSIPAFVNATRSSMADVPYEQAIWEPSFTYDFLTYLRFYALSIKQQSYSQMMQENNNKEELQSYVRRVLNKYTKSLVIRIDLSYAFDSRDKVLLDDFANHMERLRQHISNKQTCFEDLTGFAWAVEQGIDKGIHCHLWLVYDGSKRQADFHIGKAVGEKWLKITNGLGEYHNSNTSEIKALYERIGQLGIGRIHRNSQQEIEIAVNTALYLTKPDKFDQYVVVSPKGMRTFGKGVIK